MSTTLPAAPAPPDTAVPLRIQQPHFCAEEWRPTQIDGLPYLLCTCYEWTGGQWEGFVAIKQARRKA